MMKQLLKYKLKQEICKRLSDGWTFIGIKIVDFEIKNEERGYFKLIEISEDGFKYDTIYSSSSLTTNVYHLILRYSKL